jgi:hypothetical protein
VFESIAEEIKDQCDSSIAGNIEGKSDAPIAEEIQSDSSVSEEIQSDSSVSEEIQSDSSVSGI